MNELVIVGITVEIGGLYLFVKDSIKSKNGKLMPIIYSFTLIAIIAAVIYIFNAENAIKFIMFWGLLAVSFLSMSGYAGNPAKYYDGDDGRFIKVRDECEKSKIPALLVVAGIEFSLIVLTVFNK